MQEYTSTPDFYEDYICHYGVKGMKWGKRKAPVTVLNLDHYGSNLDPEIKAKREAEAKAKEAAAKVKATTTSSTKKGSSSKKKTAEDLLKRFKLTKGKSSSKKESTAKEKKTSEKKESAAKEKKTSEKKESTAKETKSGSEQEKVVYKTQISDTYTKYLERLMEGKNKQSQLDTDELKKRAAKKRNTTSLKGDKFRKVW